MQEGRNCWWSQQDGKRDALFNQPKDPKAVQWLQCTFQELNKIKCCLWTLLLQMKPCMQHVGHPKCHPAGRKAEDTPRDNQNASMEVRGRVKVTEHPSKTVAKPVRAQNFLQLLSNFVQVWTSHTLADRNQQECQRKCSSDFPESDPLSPARDPQVNQTFISYLQSQGRSHFCNTNS